MRWPGIVVALGATACFKPVPIEGAACNAAGECPDGLSCIGDVCISGGVPVDGGADADVPPSCAPHPALGAFRAPALVMELSTVDGDGTPSFSPDRLEVFFKSSRIGTEGLYDLWEASRASPDDPWGAPVNLGGLNTTADELGAEISADGLTLYFSSNRTGTTGDLDFYMARRPDRASPFGAPTRIAELSSPELDEGIFVSPDETVAYFHSKRLDLTAEARLFRASRASPSDAWSTPVEVAELTSGTGDENPWVTADDCVIYFQSTRAGGTGLADIWRAERPAPGAPFDAPVDLGVVNSNAYDADPQLSADERYLMFVSNRPGVGYFDIYESSR
jgi:Tol biopolymer transport system component